MGSCCRHLLIAWMALAAPAAVAAPGGGAAREPRKNDPIPPVVESANERRAVRGVPLEGAGLEESPELRELRRFEEDVFPRGPAPGSPAGDPAADGREAALPGRWRGTGDIPSVLRTPETPRLSAGAAAATAAPESQWLRSLALPELPVVWDPQVVRYLEYFKNDAKGRAIMSHWLRRLGRYRTLFERTLEREKLPKDLVYLAMIESGFEPHSRSRVGAGGIWQFMPGAARAYGLEVSYWVDGRNDPERSAVAAARYLKDLQVRFGGWHLALAAYNAGYGAVLKSIARYNTNDFWELTRHEAGLPWESSVYVPKILAAAIIGHNLAAFGFADVEPDPAFAYDRVEPAAGTTLATIARAAGTRPDVVAALNPELVRDRTPPDRPPTAVRVPPGTRALYAEAIETTRSAADRVDTAVLRFGETIDDVARSRGMTPRELRRLNGVKDSAELRAGATIVVPRRAAASEPAAAAREDDDDDTILVALPDRVFTDEGRERVFYRTRDGDVLDEIAEAFEVAAGDLCEWNNLDAQAKLHPRMILQVFVRKGLDASDIALLDPAKVRVVTVGSDEFLDLEAARRGKRRFFYSVRPGDTLAKVGRRYGLTPGDLARINRFSYNSELEPGQKIVVYSPTGELPRETTMGRAPEIRRPVTKPSTATPPEARPAAATKIRAKLAPAEPRGVAHSKADTKAGHQKKAAVTGLKPASTSSASPQRKPARR